MERIVNPKQWYPPPDRKVAPMAWFIPLALTSCIVSSLLPREARLKIAVPALVILFAFLARETRQFCTGEAGEDYARAAYVLGLVQKFIDFEILAKEGEIHKLKKRMGAEEQMSKSAAIDDGGQGETILVSKEHGIWKRFKDNLELWLFAMRGVGWNWEVGGIPPHETQSRRYFLFRTSLRLFGSYVALDLCLYMMGRFAYIKSPVRTPFFEEPFLHQVALTWLHQLMAFCFINIPYQVGALLTVAVGFQAAEDWPPLFGNLSDAYLVSRAWGRTWHQLMRRPLGMLTPYIQTWLKATSRAGKRTISLFSSFAMSGFSHWFGTLNLGWTPSAPGMFMYFLMQAPIIRIEDYIIEWGQARGIKGNPILKGFGYLWTVSWISFSMRWAARYREFPIFSFYT